MIKGKLYFKEDIKLSTVSFKKSVPYDYVKTDPNHSCYFVVVKEGYVAVEKEHIKSDSNNELTTKKITTKSINNKKKK